MIKTIAVFCGSSKGKDPAYMAAAKKLGTVLANENVNLVYGGASIGCMGALADAVIEGGGKVTGVMPEKLAEKEMAHDRLTNLHIVKDMHERKALMAHKADAFIAFPGGIGTMEEWFEVFTWGQIGYHEKPCTLFNVNHYYDPLLELVDHMISQGFVNKECKNLIMTDDDAAGLITRIKKTATI